MSAESMTVPNSRSTGASFFDPVILSLGKAGMSNPTRKLTEEPNGISGDYL